ncbi:N-acetylglucosamine-6-phosphate deacetylase NagA [Octadecabacter antarcticus 307]|uniref:N-acetylglucosamine-6-phosphate deacetylase NagA n=1 Tax=Octadecabacter antarcticus 307 TaxID=391626 RepID=M9RD67_9RHOB|nr:N-acetylglucosamine-6-phosphate deacetylase [Octadecabacter antarcticus]AGI69703.1 N-acetylglucosamine-6-phosphate deacetylase NagA [Octadecabacter antarcticus 307]
MTSQWVFPDRVFDGATLRDSMAMQYQHGRIVGLRSVGAVPLDAQKVQIAGTVSPGFVDLQVNGGGGVLLNDNPTLDGMRAIIQAHRQFGTVAVMPTVITDTHDVMAAAADAAIKANGELGFVGLHIEGPHISQTRRGTHGAQFIRPLDGSTIAVVAKLARAGISTMITVAPEAATSAQIAELAGLGAVVSLGHTDATSQQVTAAFAAGATCATHLFNAMSQMLNRSPGTVGAVINSQAYAGIICDGRHVADEMVGLAIRARPVSGRMFLVSDAMPTVGGPDAFELYGDTIMLKDGQLVNSEGSLAGAHITMAQSVQRLVSVVGVERETALQMAITVPAHVIKQPALADVLGRSIDDLLVLGEDCTVIATLGDLLSASDDVIANKAP